MSEAAEGFILLARVHQLVAQSVLAWILGRLYNIEFSSSFEVFSWWLSLPMSLDKQQAWLPTSLGSVQG